MNNFKYTVMNIDIPVMYIGVIVHIYVKYVIRHLVKRATSEHINAYIVVSVLIPVKSVKRHSGSR
jgi:hypothetical protein